MKTSTLIGLTLTLLMLLLVLLAAFLFLFQGRQLLIQQYEGQVATLEQKQAETDLQLLTLEGTRTAIERQILTPQAQELEAVKEENSLLNQQSVADLQELEALRAIVTQTADGVTPVATAVLQPAIIRLLSPDNNATISLDSDLEVILVARDDRGIEKIELTVNDEVRVTIEGNSQTFLTHKEQFSFVSTGSQVLEAKLTNIEGGVTMTQLVRIDIVAPDDNGG